MNKVRLVVSSLTDTRFIERELESRNVAVAFDQVSMASGERREYFRELQQQHNWHSLPMVFLDDEFIGGELELLERLPAQPSLAPPSQWAWCLALSGVIPFVAMALWFWLGKLPLGMAFNSTFSWAYGPIILSFMAAVQWGAALAASGEKQQHRWYAFSVLPALVGWFALAVYLDGHVIPATLMVFAGFVVVFFGDDKATKQGLLPAWYLRLRIVLTALVLPLLAIVAIAASVR